MPADEYMAVSPSLAFITCNNGAKKMSVTAEQVEAVTIALIERGLLIEAGWIALAKVAYPEATEQQYEMLRQAFFAGAQHLFASIMNVLSAGEDNVTVEDLQRMDNIHKELEDFIQKFRLQYLTPAQGNS